MIDFTKPHNWIGLAVVILVVGFVMTQVGRRVPAAIPLARASGYGS